MRREGLTGLLSCIGGDRSHLSLHGVCRRELEKQLLLRYCLLSRPSVALNPTSYMVPARRIRSWCIAKMRTENSASKEWTRASSTPADPLGRPPLRGGGPLGPYPDTDAEQHRTLGVPRTIPWRGWGMDLMPPTRCMVCNK